MNIIVENFGPVKRADVEIRFLTIFVGPNATGKSYVAYLVHSLLAAEPDWTKLLDHLEGRLKRDVDDLKQLEVSVVNALNEFFKGFETFMRDGYASVLKDVYGVSKLSDLISHGQSFSQIIVH